MVMVSNGKEMEESMETVVEKFLRYVKIDTQSSETANTFPSTEKQKDLGRLLYEELNRMGAKDVFFDENFGYVYAKIPATGDWTGEKTLGLLAHMDTSPETSGKNVNPRIVENYNGEEIILNKEQNVVLSPVQFPELTNYIGKQLIVTDGTTLLGADDKAGVAEIMAMAEILLTDSSYSHGEISICFTPDEEIGAGVDHIDLQRFAADYAYTVDGGQIGELEYENFNAASAIVKIKGRTVHPGEAKGKMLHAGLVAMEFENMLPKEQKPEYTSGYEGFYHLTQMSGTVEEAALNYIIRDHDRKRFEEKKKIVEQTAVFLNQKYGPIVEVEINDSYYNMREIIEPDFLFLVENAKRAMEEVGITPIIQPIRGGTDGARLSFMGVPCPNICTGGHNYHGRYEYCCVESMEAIVKLLVRLVSM